MTPYEWHPNPDPHPPHPPSLFHHPLSPPASSAYTQPNSSSLFSVRTRHRKASGNVLSDFPSLPLFLSLPFSHQSSSPLTPPPSFGFGEAAIRPCPSLLTNRQIRKQSVNRIRGWRLSWLASGRIDFFFLVWIKDWEGSLLSSPLEYHCRAGNLVPVPLLFPQLSQLRCRMLWRMVHQENCSYQVVLKATWPHSFNCHFNRHKLMLILLLLASLIVRISRFIFAVIKYPWMPLWN